MATHLDSTAARSRYAAAGAVIRDLRQKTQWRGAAATLERGAKAGDPVAQLHFGFCYRTARGREFGWRKALRMFRLAAKKGLAAARVELGRCIEEWPALGEDYAEASCWPAARG